MKTNFSKRNYYLKCKDDKERNHFYSCEIIISIFLIKNEDLNYNFILKRNFPKTENIKSLVNCSNTNNFAFN